MADSMKFGPEWLRNMSQDGNPSGGPAPPITSSGPKYQLADYRYGREEMLALYDEQAVISSPTTLALANLDPVLYSEVVQTPVSFIPMTEEETRIYNRGFNSRGFSNPSLGSDPSSGGGKPFSKMNTSPLLGATPQATNNSFRSRNQAGIERGRGRGVPGSSYHTRPGIKDGSDLYNNTMNRNRFGVNSDLQSNRGWGDRNGILDPDSKKEGQGLHNRQHNASGGSVSDSNWRRFREDDEPWRPNFNRTNSTGNNTEKWGGRGSWRQQAEQNARSSERDDDKWEKERGGSKWDDSKNQNQYSSNSNNTNSNSNNGVNRLRRYSFNEDNLPEWATENLSETRGDNTPNPCYEDSISPPGPYGTDSPSKQHFENISPTRHLDGTSSPMKPPAMKPNEVGGYKDSPQADKGEMHHQKTSSPSHKNSAMEPNNRLDSNELMNQRLSKVVDDIDRLITEEDSKEPPQHMESPTSNGIDANIKDKWLYKDPQGSVQGPFTSAEMAEWYRSGYFRSNLLVRRLCDEQFSPLGDLFHFYGNIPFLADNSFPAIKASDHIASQTTNPRDEALLIQQFRDVQYKRAVLSQQQQLVNTVVKNLQQHDNWNNLSILEQQSLISQHMNRILHTTNIGAILFNQPTPAPINIPPNNPIMQLVAEMTRQDTHFPTPHAPNVGSHMPMSGAAPPQHRPTQDPIPTPSPHHESPHLNHSPHPEPNKPHVQMDHSQPAGPPHIPIDHSQSQQNNSVHMFLRQVLAAQQSMPNPPSMSQMLGQQPPHSPHQSLQGSHVWGAPGEKDFMRLDSNNYYPQPPMGGPEPPNVHNQTQLDQFLRMVMGKDMENKDPSLIRPQEEKKPEAAPVSGPERSKPDEVKQTGEEKKRKKQQEEKEQMEAEARKQREKEEQQQLKQQQQQTKKQQKAQQQQGGENQKSKKSDKKNEANMKLGWNSAKPVPVKIQSLAEIQAEQTEQLAKQLEKEKQERLANPRAQIELARSKTQIWGGSSSVPTNYAQASAKAVPSKINHVKQPQSSAIISNPSSGFWDEPVKILTNPATASKNSKSISNSKSTNSLGSSSALSSSNSKAKKEEIKIKEIFTTSALKETSSSEFYNWCKNSLASMKINELDVPTFIGFLKDVESPKEVKDYVKLYIGEGKQAMNFANQYLEKRQACNDNINNFTNSAIKANNREQSKSKSISNVLNASKKTEFVEVKGKNKKNKKGKMRAVDTTLLGFSVTADPDRFNVGERELPDV
ncbi:hypothetical protein M8J75_001537 [Diaphorina citri]|nr:hypothetical protein M8J75_001537 [Diaphorina citri]